MDTVIDNLARALRRLAGAGVEHAVVSADHGHLFFAQDRDESMRTDAPGGHTVDLHRRCWIGRGGATPASCVRVTAASLGYASDLEFVFPVSTCVFKAGGDLAFHHGGPSLQELVVPVLTVRTRVRDSVRPDVGSIQVSGLPEVVNNRIFKVVVKLAPMQYALGESPQAAVSVRVLLASAGRQVGTVFMVVGADFDQPAGTVALVPNKDATIIFQLSDESADKLRVVVQDPATDAQLYRSPTDISVRFGV